MYAFFYTIYKIIKDNAIYLSFKYFLYGTSVEKYNINPGYHLRLVLG